MASGTDEKVKYICLVVHRWAGCELKDCPPGIFDGLNDGSIGFMPIFDDVEKMKAAYPDADIIKATRTGG